MSNIESMVEVMRAYDKGAEIQFRHKDCDEKWCEISKPTWDWWSNEYRIKPKPEPKVIHLSAGQKFRIRTSNSGECQVVLFQVDPGILKAFEIFQDDIAPNRFSDSFVWKLDHQIELGKKYGSFPNEIVFLEELS